MNSQLKGKKALVTGGGSGIGRAISLALAREGVDVAIASRNPDAETASQIEALGVRAAQLSVDVSDEQQVVAMVRQAIDKLGGLGLHVNNAAAAWHQPVTKLTAEAWSGTIKTAGTCSILLAVLSGITGL